MAESTLGVIEGLKQESRFGKLLARVGFRRGERVAEKSENELRLEAFGEYRKKLAESKDSTVRSVADALESRLQSLSSGFSRARKENPALTARQFLESENKGGSHLTIEGAGWNPEEPSLDAWAKVKHDKGREWAILTSPGISDLLGENDYVPDSRFGKSSTPSHDSMAYAVKSAFGGSVSETGKFEEYWASVKNPDLSKAGVLVGLKKEEGSPVAPHDYFTGHEGGIRGVAVMIGVDTIAAEVEKQVSSQRLHQ